MGTANIAHQKHQIAVYLALALAPVQCMLAIQLVDRNNMYLWQSRLHALCRKKSMMPLTPPNITSPSCIRDTAMLPTHYQSSIHVLPLEFPAMPCMHASINKHLRDRSPCLGGRGHFRNALTLNITYIHSTHA